MKSVVNKRKMDSNLNRGIFLRFNKKSMTRLALTLLLSLFILSFIFIIGGVNSQIVVTTCQNITSAGSYQLSNSLSPSAYPSAGGACINISISDVSLDCVDWSNYIQGVFSNATFGIYATNTSKLTNVTITNCNVTNFYRGISLKFVQNSTVDNFTSSSCNTTLYLSSTKYNNFTNIFSSNTRLGVGVYFDAGNLYNQLINTSITNTLDNSLYFYKSSYINVTNLTTSFSSSGSRAIMLDGDTIGGAGSSHHIIITNTNVINSGSDGIRLNGNNTYNVFSNININNCSNSMSFINSSFNNITRVNISNSRTTSILIASASTNNLQNSSYNRFWDNYFNDTIMLKTTGINWTNYFNTTLSTGINVLGFNGIGGNYWKSYPRTPLISSASFIGVSVFDINSSIGINDSLPLEIETPPIVSSYPRFNIYYKDSGLTFYNNYSDAEDIGLGANSSYRVYNSSDGIVYSLLRSSNATQIKLFNFENTPLSSDGENYTSIGGKPQYPNGRFGKGISFNGTNDYICYNDSGINWTEVTFSFYVNFTNITHGDYNKLFSWYFDSTHYFNIETYNNQLYAGSSSATCASANVLEHTAPYINDSKFHHIVVTLKNGKPTYGFVDGIYACKSSVNYATISHSGSNETCFGARADSHASTVNATIDNFAIINKYLSIQEVQAINNTQIYQNQIFLSPEELNLSEGDYIITSYKGYNLLNTSMWVNSSVIRIASGYNITSIVNFSKVLFKINMEYGANEKDASSDFMTYPQNQLNEKAIKSTYIRIWLLNRSYTTTFGQLPWNGNTYNYKDLDTYVYAVLNSSAIPILLFDHPPESITATSPANESTPPTKDNMSFYAWYTANVTRRYYDLCISHWSSICGAGTTLDFIKWQEQIGNEMDSNIWFGSDENYTTMVNMSMIAIRSSVPNANIILAPLIGNTVLTSKSLANITPQYNSIATHIYAKNAILSGDTTSVFGLLYYTYNVYFEILNLRYSYVYPYTTKLFDVTENNLNPYNPTDIRIFNKVGGAFYSSMNNWLARSRNVSKSILFEGSGDNAALTNIGTLGYGFGIWSNKNPWGTTPMFLSAKIWNSNIINNSQVVDSSTSDYMIELMPIITPNNVKKIAIINKHNANISNLEITLNTNYGSVWDIANYSYVESLGNSINLSIADYNTTVLGLQADKFNLTEGSNTGLLDINGNEITDDVGNVLWITSSSTSSFKGFGNNLSIISNGSLVFNVSHCNINRMDYKSNTGAYTNNYTSGWSCNSTSKQAKLNQSNLQTATGSSTSLNRLWITYNAPNLTISSPNSTQYTAIQGTPTKEIAFAFNLSESVTACNYSINYSSAPGLSGMDTENTTIASCLNFSKTVGIPNSQLDNVNYYTANFYLTDSRGIISTIRQGFSIKMVTSDAYTGGGGGGGGGDGNVLANSLGLGNLDTYVCNKTYGYILKNGQNSLYLTDLIAEMKREKGIDYSFIVIETYVRNWQGLCAEKISRSLEPKFVCEKIYYFIIGNNWNYTNANFEALRTTISEKVSMTAKLLTVYFNNYDNLCYKLGYSNSLPKNPYIQNNIVAPIKDFFNFTTCNIDTGVAFFDWKIPFMKVDMGSELSCNKIDNLRFWIAMDVDDNGNYSWIGFKVWEVIVLLCIPVFFWIRSIVRKVSSMRDEED